MKTEVKMKEIKCEICGGEHFKGGPRKKEKRVKREDFRNILKELEIDVI